MLRTEFTGKFNPKWAGLGLYLISQIPGRVDLGGMDLTIGEILAHSIVSGARETGGEPVLIMSAAIASLEEFTTEDLSLADRVREMNFFGGELRETLGYAILAPASGEDQTNFDLTRGL